MAIKSYITTSLREMFEYLRNPQENIPMSYQPKSIARSYAAAITMLVVMFLVVILVLVILFISCPSLIHGSTMISDISKYPWWIVAILGPVVEELNFRLSLVRKNAYLACSLTIACFNVISRCAFAREFYTTDYIWARIGVSVLVGAAIFLAFRKWLTKCDYRIYFYAWAFLFGIAHITRIDFATLLPMDYFIVLLYLAKQFGMGILLGYVRMKNGIASSIILHILNNSL